MAEKKEQVVEAAAVVEEKAMVAADSLEKSKLGESIPLEIVNVSLCDITKYLMFFIIFDAIPIYLISCESAGDKEKMTEKVTGFMRSLLKSLFIFSVAASALLNIVAFYGKMLSLYKFVVPAAIFKTGMAVIIVVCTSFWYSYTALALSVIYSLKIVALDSLFLYYLAMLLKRIESDDYDGNGERLKSRDHEEKV